MGFEALVPGREMPGVDGKGNRHQVSTLGEEAGEGGNMAAAAVYFSSFFPKGCSLQC